MPISSSAGVLNEARSRVKIMGDDEVVVFDLLRKLSAGQLYDVYVEHEVLVRTMVIAAEEEGKRTRCVSLLRRMEERGLLKESASGWKAVR